MNPLYSLIICLSIFAIWLLSNQPSPKPAPPRKLHAYNLNVKKLQNDSISLNSLICTPPIYEPICTKVKGTGKGHYSIVFCIKNIDSIPVQEIIVTGKIVSQNYSITNDTIRRLESQAFEPVILDLYLPESAPPLAGKDLDIKINWQDVFRSTSYCPECRDTLGFSLCEKDQLKIADEALSPN